MSQDSVYNEEWHGTPEGLKMTRSIGETDTLAKDISEREGWREKGANGFSMFEVREAW